MTPRRRAPCSRSSPAGALGLALPATASAHADA